MNINEVIKYPMLTEKSYAQMDNGVYTFSVDKRTNKVEVRKAIETIFGVKVRNVNIFNVPKKPTKLGRFNGFTNAFKKAIITLEEGETINIFPNDAAPTEAEVKKAKVKKVDDKPKELSEAEKKAAAKIAAKAKADAAPKAEEKKDADK